MDDLVQWLGEQYDEDERIARAADAELSNVFTRIANFDPEMAADERHIMAHRPARVLREIDAKRQLLDDYVVTARIRDEASARIKAAGDHPDSKDIYTWDQAEREAMILEGPVKLAALPYADRPGYREEWRP